MRSALAILLVLGGLFAADACPPGGASSERTGSMTPEQVVSILIERLHALRADPDGCRRLLDTLREKAVRFGGRARLDARMAVIRDLIGEALDSSDAVFDRRCASWARGIQRQLYGHDE